MQDTLNTAPGDTSLCGNIPDAKSYLAELLDLSGNGIGIYWFSPCVSGILEFPHCCIRVRAGIFKRIDLADAFHKRDSILLAAQA